MDTTKKPYHGMTPYRFSFINPETGARNYWVRFYGDDMEVALSDSKEAALREVPGAHGFMIESDQGDAAIRKSWGLPE